MRTSETAYAKDERESLPTRVKYLLWWCAGADMAALKECPTDHAKFTAVGMMMLVVPCVAMVSFNFFVRQSFGAETFAATIGGVAWGALIFVLDRLILTFHRKGKREVLRALPRLILSLSLALVISEPLLLRFFQSEIDLEMRRAGQAVMTDARAKAEARGQAEKESLLNANADLQKRLDDLKRVRDEKQAAVIGEIEGTVGSGVKGEGLAARQKQEALQEAKDEYGKTHAEFAPLLAENKKRLEQLRAETEAEVKLIADSQASATGALARQQALYSIIKREPSAALTYVPLFLILLMIEIAPLTMKLTAPAGEYDKRLRLREANGVARAHRDTALERAEQRRAAKAENGVKGRITQAVIDDKTDRLSDAEQETAALLRGTLLESFRQEILAQHAPQSWRRQFDGQVLVEIVDLPELSVSWQLPAIGRESVTLAELDGDLQKIAEAVAADETQSVRLVRTTSSSGREVMRELPLLPQLGADQKLKLTFELLHDDLRELPLA
jgi:hypothetical protein